LEHWNIGTFDFDVSKIVRILELARNDLEEVKHW
jgi:hypothetical protein